MDDYEIGYKHVNIKVGDRVKYRIRSVGNVGGWDDVPVLVTFIEDEPEQQQNFDASKYTVIINEETHGPYDQMELQQMAQQGTLTRETLVWKEGMAQWDETGMIEELVSIFVAVPPPLPPK
jgi:hypothetical protein